MRKFTIALLVSLLIVSFALPALADLHGGSQPDMRAALSAPELSALGDTTFQYGVSPDASYTGVADTYIDSENPLTVNGSDGIMKLAYDGRRRVLIRFDLSALPSTTIVTAAQLELNVSVKQTARGPASTFNVYEVLRPWVESEAYWRRAAVNSPWQEFGCNAAGMDRATEYSASGVFNSTGWFTFSSLELVGLVQKWINNPAANNGLLIVGSADNLPQHWTLISSQSLRPDLRPKLVVSSFVAAPSRTPTATLTPVLPATPTRTATPGPTLTPTEVFTQALVSGVTWYDESRSGVYDPFRPRLSNVVVVLKDARYQEIGRQTTGDDGSFEFGELSGGDYVLTVETPPGLECTSPPDCVYAFYLTGVQHLAELNFGFSPPPTPTPTSTATPTATGTATATPTGTATATPTNTPFGMPTFTPTATRPTETPTATATATATPVGSFSDPIAVQCQRLYEGNTAGHASVYADYGDCASGLWGPEVIYVLHLDRPLDYLSINLDTQGDLMLAVLASANPADCLTAGGAVALPNVQPGTYYIVVDGSGMGSYAMEVLCFPPSGPTATATPTVTPTQPGMPSPTPTTGPTFTPTATRTPGGGMVLYLPIIRKPPLEFLVDCGASGAYTDVQGRRWMADQPYRAGSWGYVGSTETFGSSNSIAGTSDGRLYQTSRFAYGSFGYAFDVPNGTYDVQLLFAELYYPRTGKRVFSVHIEGQAVLSNFDIVAAAGGWLKARTETFVATVNDQQLNVDLVRGSADFPLLNALRVTKIR